jgi:dihydrofolate reductase
MGKVLLEMSMSLDGYVAGPDVGAEAPMGRSGELLHDWMFEGRSAAESQRFEADHFSSVGALIIGRRMADLGIGLWGDEPTFHAPVFVVTHRPAETIVKRGGTSYVFVTEGIDHALLRAREAAGPDDVQVSGGADIARQYLTVGAIEELRLHLVPVIMGGGTRLFGEGSSPNVRLRPIGADTSPLATHLTYAVERAGTKGS